MISPEDVCNLALIRLGMDTTIQSIAEPSPEARACSKLYDPARRALLTARRWPFALRQRGLAASGTPPDRWTYSYAYPSDALIVLSVVNPASASTIIRYEIGADVASSRALLFCDTSPAVIEYVCDFTVVAQMPSPFTEALSWRLARDLALPLTQKTDRIQAMDGGYKTALLAMSAAAANEGRPRQLPDPDWIAARG